MLQVKNENISESASASDMVKADYRTVAVFRKYGIEFCCGGKWPLALVCDTKQLDKEMVLDELQQSTRKILLPSYLPFYDWKINFLADYIVNVHHYYLRSRLPLIEEQLKSFVSEHRKKYTYLDEVELHFGILKKMMIPHLQHEEEIVFPYIKQMAHAYESKESYAALLVRTLRKPIKEIMHHEHDVLDKILHSFRTLTENYTAPPSACASHRVTFSLLQELDNDLVQHVYLENEVLFPRAIAMEKELLESK